MLIIFINLAMTTMLTRLVENEEGGKFWWKKFGNWPTRARTGARAPLNMAASWEFHRNHDHHHDHHDHHHWATGLERIVRRGNDNSEDYQFTLSRHFRVKSAPSEPMSFGNLWSKGSIVPGSGMLKKIWWSWWWCWLCWSSSSPLSSLSLHCSKYYALHYLDLRPQKNSLALKICMWRGMRSPRFFLQTDLVKIFTIMFILISPMLPFWSTELKISSTSACGGGWGLLDSSCKPQINLCQHLFYHNYPF